MIIEVIPDVKLAIKKRIDLDCSLYTVTDGKLKLEMYETCLCYKSIA